MAGEDLTNESRAAHIMYIKNTAGVHVLLGSLLVLLGIVAAILWAYWSYVVTPIWTGLAIFTVAGLLGNSAGSSQTRSAVGKYIAMSCIAAATSVAMVILYGFAAAYEGKYRIGDFAVCHPGVGDEYIINCSKSEAARITFDVFILIGSFFELVNSVLAVCYACSFIANSTPSPPPPTVSGTVMASNTVALQQAGGVPMPVAGQPTAAVYFVQQPPGGQPYPEPQVMVPQGYVVAPIGQQMVQPYLYPPQPQPGPQAMPSSPPPTYSAPTEPYDVAPK